MEKERGKRDGGCREREGEVTGEGGRVGRGGGWVRKYISSGAALMIKITRSDTPWRENKAVQGHRRRTRKDTRDRRSEIKTRKWNRQYKAEEKDENALKGKKKTTKTHNQTR